MSRPLPSGVAILEIGIDEGGRVVSACVLRGLRNDFDEAAQQAALQSRWKPQLLNGRPVGAVMTVTFLSPVPGRWSRSAVTSVSVLPIRRNSTTCIAPSAACPPSDGEPTRLAPDLGPPMLEYAEPLAPTLLDVSGTVILAAVIAPDGRVTNVKPLRPVEGLTDPAVDAVRKWRFARTCVAGHPVSVSSAIALTYGTGSRAAER